MRTPREGLFSRAATSPSPAAGLTPTSDVAPPPSACSVSAGASTSWRPWTASRRQPC